MWKWIFSISVVDIIRSRIEERERYSRPPWYNKVRKVMK